MEEVVHIGEAARRLNVTPEHLRNLEREGKIPPPRRDFNGRIYSQSDIRLLKALGVGQRLRRLRRTEDMLETMR